MPPELDDAPEAAPPDEIAELLTQLPQDAMVDLLRWNDGGAKPGYKALRTFQAAGFSTALVARQYGGGDYRVFVRFKKDGKGSVERRDFGVDPAVKPEGAPAAAPAAPASSALTADRAVWELLQLQIEGLKALITSVPRESPSEMFKAAVELVKANQPPPSAQRDPIELATKLLELTGGRGDARPSIAELLEDLERIRELAGSGDSDSMSRALVTVAHTIEKLAEREAARPPQLPPGARPALAVVPRTPAPAAAQGSPAPAPAPEPAPAAAEPTPVTAPWFPYLAPFLPLLVQAAAQDSDPELYADLLLDQLPPAADPVINELLAHPDYPSNVLRELPPETASAHQWLAKMFAAVRAELTEPPGQEAAP